MKKAFGLFLAVTLASAALAHAQDASSPHIAASAESKDSTSSSGEVLEKTAIDLFHLDGTYVFGSDITTRDNYGKQAEVQSEAEYSHRFLLSGHVYFRAGFKYERFDFDRTLAPLPLHLQSYSALFAVEYMHGNDIGAFFQIQPGFYTENDIDSASFDVPITAGRVFVLTPDKLYFFAGVNASFLRGQYSPVLPIAGIVYRPNKQWTVDLIPPEPRIIYAPNDNWDFYLGGQITGSSFRTDRKSDPFFPPKLNGAQVDYFEYRAGIGISYNPCKQVSLDLIGGYDFERQFDFARADKKYTADPAPYIRLSMKAEF